jgi:hypothetical protein
MARSWAALSCALSLAACSMLGMDKARVAAISAAAYAGDFRLHEGRWPQTDLELQRYVCLKEGWYALTDAGMYSCDEIEPGPYRWRMRNVGRDLEMTLLDAGQRPVCRLKLFEPTKGDLASSMVVRTTVFSCPGDGREIE